MENTKAEAATRIAGILHAYVGEEVSDVEFGELVDRILAAG